MATKTKVLLLFGGGVPYHTEGGQRDSLLKMLQPAFDVTLSESLDVLTPENLPQYDVIANATTFLRPSEEQINALMDFVKYGKGFASLHPGAATFFNCPRYLDMVGGKFVDHDQNKLMHIHTPTAVGGAPATARRGRVEEELHPITAGIAEFDVQDELFLIEGDQRDWYVLARCEGHPVVFLKHWFLGRVFNCTLGHDQRALTHPSVQKLYIRGIQWAAHQL